MTDYKKLVIASVLDCITVDNPVELEWPYVIYKLSGTSMSFQSSVLAVQLRLYK